MFYAAIQNAGFTRVKSALGLTPFHGSSYLKKGLLLTQHTEHLTSVLAFSFLALLKKGLLLAQHTKHSVFGLLWGDKSWGGPQRDPTPVLRPNT